MNNILSIFIPNRIVDPKILRIMVLTMVFCLGVIWFYNPLTYVPNPPDTLHAFNDLVDNGLARELCNSIILLLQAIAISTTISLGLAYLTTMAFFWPIVRFIGNLRFLSMVGLGYFFARATTGGHQQKLALLTFSITVFFVTSMADVVAQIPKVNYDLARTLGMSDWRTVWEVVVLGTGAQAFDMLRQNAAMGWMMLSMVESAVRAEGGIGAVLSDQSHHFDMGAVLALIIVILVCGLIWDYIIVVVRRICCPYADLKLERK